MKKLFVLFLIIFYVYGNKLQIIGANSYFTNVNLLEIYNKLLAYEESKELQELTNYLLKNEKFKTRLYFEEMTKVKISTLSLLKQLNYYLKGWPKYSDSMFKNNSNSAGIIKILNDSIENDINFVNVSDNIIKDIKKSILSINFFKLSSEIKSFKESVKIKQTIKIFNLLFFSFINTLSQINDPLIKAYNERIKNILLKEYRIYTNTSIFNSMKIFEKLLKENYKKIK